MLGNGTYTSPPLGTAEYGTPGYQQQQPQPLAQPAQAAYAPVGQATYGSQQPVYEQPQTYAPSVPAPIPYQQAQPVYQNYTPQIIEQPQIVYQQPQAIPYQQQPIAYQNYTQQAPVYQQEQVAYAPQVVQQQSSYVAPPVQAYSNYSAPPVYQQQQQTYAPQAPLIQQQAYAPAQPAIPSYSNYSAPASPIAPVYQPQQQSYAPQAPVVQQQAYAQAQPVAPIAQQQAYAPAQPVVQSYSNYSAPVAPVYQPQQQSYAPAAPVVQQQAYAPAAPVVQQQAYAPAAQPAIPSYNNYSAPATYQQAKPVPLPLPPSQLLAKANGYQQQQPLAPIVSQGVTSAAKYLTSLLSLTSFKNYWPNNANNYYFKAAPYKSCPKNVYLNGPTQADIQEAFRQAKLELAKVSQSSIDYIDSTQKSFAARHAFFSFLSQHSPRMDEEGLLVEYVSQYLADRACLTKWDKQRYLPQLTRLISTQNFPPTHSCASLYQRLSPNVTKYCAQSKYRTYDGFCNNPYHPYWGKANVCHIRLMSPDYADGISAPRISYNPQVPLPNPRALSNYIHNDVPLDGLYNLMKMQWGQFINHDITNTALSSYDGLVDCCKNPQARGCWPIYIPPGDQFYNKYNVTCLNFIRSGVCALCQLGPRQQSNKNTAFLDLSHIYGNTQAVAMKLRTFRGGLLIETVAKNGEPIPPLASGASQDQCTGICFQAGDNRINQHPALTALHTLLLRRHNQHARALARRHPDWNDEYLYQEARRLAIAEYQMITYGEYFPIVFGPTLSAYFNLYPLKQGTTYYNPKVDPTTWNEYSTATCRFGHSQISATFGLYNQLTAYKQQTSNLPSFRLKDWFMQPSFIYEGMTKQLILGLLSRPSDVVDPWISGDVREHLYKHAKDHSGGDLAATNIWRGRDHGIPGYINYLEFCFNYKVYSWKDLELFIPPQQLQSLKKIYGIIENIDLFTGGLAERHFPGADTGPTFACVNGIQYYHLKFGDRFYFEHANQVGSFTPIQLAAIRQTTLARLLCRTAYLDQVPGYAFLAVSPLNPAVNCAQLGEIDYNLF